MARPRKQIETPGADPAAETPEQAVETISDTSQPNPIAERNAALSELPVAALAIITAFESLGFTDIAGRQLTDTPEFIDLVKQATTTTQPAATTEDGQRLVFKAPTLTDKGWHVQS